MRPLPMFVGLLTLAGLFAPLSTAAAQGDPPPPPPRWDEGELPPEPPPRSIGNLVEDLVSEDAGARVRAARELADRKDAGVEVLPTVLRVMAHDTNTEVRSWCTVILKRLHPADAEVVDALIARLADTSPVAIGAALAIAAIGPPAAKAVPVLSQLLDAESVELRAAVATALAGIGPASAPALERLLTMLDDPQLGRYAAPALGAIGADAIAPLLERATASGAGPRRDNARLALLKTTPGAASEAARLLPLITDRDPGVRGLCLSVWSRMHATDDKVVAAMIHCLLNDGDEDVRTQVVQVLRGLHISSQPALVTAFAQCLDRESYYFVREQAVLALGDAGDAALPALPQLIRSLSNRDVTERKGAAEALAHFGPKAAEAAPILVPLIGDNDYGDSPRRALLAIGAAAVEPLVRLGLGSSEKFVRMQAAELLGKLGATAASARDALQRVADKDADAYVRRRAAAALAQIDAAGK
ncbi:MAG: HEAT repeat domain-containing protein [Planctomycetota bacterium]